MITINKDIDAGNIIVESITNSDVALSIRPDTQGNDFQWFYFRASVPTTINISYRIYNAASASYHKAWIGYNVLASYDEQTWFRVPTRYDGSHLIWQLQAEEETVSFAFFVPYSSEQRETLLQEAASESLVERRSLGKTSQNRDLGYLVFGDESDSSKKVIWIVSRQHAGEPMAEYATEGFIRRLLDTRDSAAQELLKKAIIYVVPNMNPDGSYLGNLRANSAGVDLNRVWNAPQDNAPEIQSVLKAIEKTGVDYFIDMHGDETRPFIWIIPSTIKPELEAVHNKFVQYFFDNFSEMGAVPEEIIVGVAPAPGMSINHMTRAFGCPGWIVELPFKETPVGDTLLAEGCRGFGRACVDALLHVMD